MSITNSGNKFLAILGHINIDFIMTVSSIPSSGSAPVSNIREVYGGTAGNFSMVSAALKVEFDLYSAVSRKTHQNYLEFLSEKGIDISNILIDEEDRGPICYAASTGKDQVYFVYQGPMSKPFIHQTIRRDRHYKYLHLGTGDPSDLKYALGNMSYDQSAFDPGQELNYRYSSDQISFFLENCDLAIFNDSEADFARSMVPRFEMGKRGAAMIITHGSRGCTVSRNGKSTDIKAKRAEKVFDTVGAGDAFRSGLYLGLSRNMDLEDSAVLGSIVSSIAIQKPIKEFNTSEDEIIKIYKNEKHLLRGI